MNEGNRSTDFMGPGRGAYSAIYRASRHVRCQRCRAAWTKKSQPVCDEGVCERCEAAGWRRNAQAMENWRRRGNVVERLPGGGFAIKGKEGA